MEDAARTDEIVDGIAYFKTRRRAVFHATFPAACAI